MCNSTLAPDYQLLHEKRITEPKNGADVVVLRYAVEHDRYRPAWLGKKLAAGQFGAAQLCRCQRPAHNLTSDWQDRPSVFFGQHDGNDALGDRRICRVRRVVGQRLVEIVD